MYRLLRSVLHGVMLAYVVGAWGWAESREPQASAHWVAESRMVLPGQSLRTAVKLAVQPGWHVYWKNAGDAGMATRATWELPAGWQGSGLQYLAPMRFQAGGLHGFGYGDEVWFPVSLQVPEDFHGEVTLRGELSWLACNEDACIPGTAPLQLTLTQGALARGDDAVGIQSAYRMLPVEAPAGVVMGLRDMGESWELQIEGPDGFLPDWVGATLLPATPAVIAPSAPLVLGKAEAGKWVVSAAKSEYAPAEVEVLELWLMPPGGLAPPVLLHWKAAKKD